MRQGLTPEHTLRRVLAASSEEVPGIVSPRSDTNTIIAGCSAAGAAGQHIPPYFVFKGVRVYPELMDGATPGSSYTMSPTGWSNSNIFHIYI